MISLSSPGYLRRLSLPPSRRVSPSRLQGGFTAARQNRQISSVASLRVFPFDQAWSPSIDQASLAPQIFAFSLFPYLGFLYFLTKSNKAPRLMLFGFYFLLVFVGVSIPAGIYAKVHYGTSLSNVDWLHGSAEVFLSVTNLLIVLGLRQAIREAENKNVDALPNEAVTESTSEVPQIEKTEKGAGDS